MSSALLVMDLINDLVHEDGSVGKDGFFAQARERGVLAHTACAIAHARAAAIPVVYVVVGFSPSYGEWSPKPKLFRHVRDRKQVILGNWATQIHNSVAPLPNEIIIIKNRINPFYGTNIEAVLKANGVTSLFLCGVSTEFVVLATAMAAHDRDYEVTVLEDCVSSINSDSHASAIMIIGKIADIETSTQFCERTF